MKGLWRVWLDAPGVKRLEACIEADTREEAIAVLRGALARGEARTEEVGP